MLKAKGIAARVVSMPCMDAFFEQPEAYRRSVIGSSKVKVGVEAAVRQGWDAIIGDGPFVGMTSYGGGAPSPTPPPHPLHTPAAPTPAARGPRGRPQPAR